MALGYHEIRQTIANLRLVLFQLMKLDVALIIATASLMVATSAVVEAATVHFAR